MNEGTNPERRANEERLAGGRAKFLANRACSVHRHSRCCWLVVLSCLMLVRLCSAAIDSSRPGGRSSYYGNGVWLHGDDAQDSNAKGRQTANDVNCFAHGGAIDLDPDWMVAAPSNTRRNNHQLRNEQAASQKPRHINLPELEPMRLERPGEVHHTQVTVRLTYAYGSVARLPCPVRQLSNRTVSWMKHSPDNVQLLTVGNTTYANDNRLAVAWRYPGNWTLQISAIDLSDAGCYQCQVNTHPPIGLFVYLQVQGPAVTIVDDRNVSVSEAVFKSGALIRLVCLVRQAERDTFSLLWMVGASVLNHDTQRGGVSVKTERRGRDAISWLLIARASSRDSGVYTCSVDSHSQATVSVHVIQGEQQAAVQELTSGAGGWHESHQAFWLFVFHVIAAVSSIRSS